MAIEPTEEQQAVVDQIGAKPHLIVQAYAGCAKTSTLELASQKVRVPGLALAFNKSIASEMSKRISKTFKVQTLNGFGYGAWMRGQPEVSKWDLDGKKVGKLCSQVAKDHKVELSGDQWDSLRQLVGSAMLSGLVPRDEGQPLVPDRLETWQDLADDCQLDKDDFAVLYDLARDVLEENNRLARQGIISFDDQVYCPTVLGGKWPQYPVVFVDESQDLSPLNHRMLELGLRPGGKLVAVGDSRQAIYAFRGADAQSMQRVEELMLRHGELAERKLTLTFRCPKVVVERQQEHAPGFRAWSQNPQGSFARWEQTDGQRALGEFSWTWKEVERALEQVPKARPQLAVLCRNNGPLLALAFKLIRQGIGPVMLGRDIGKGLVQLSRKLCPEDSCPADLVAGKVEDWKEKECALARANRHEEKVAGICDRAECLQAVLTHAEVRDAGQLRLMLEKLFSRSDGQVTLSSIHKAKGLEWDFVLHLDPWRVPSKWARRAAMEGDHSQLEQEWNLKYVCETRSKFMLVEADLGDFQ